MPPPKSALNDEAHIDPVFQILQQSSAIRIVSDTSTGSLYRDARIRNSKSSGEETDSDNSPRHIQGVGLDDLRTNFKLPY